MNKKHSDKEFATRAVWSGTQNIEGAAVTPIFNTATYQLTDERYAGWAAGAQHTALYSRLSSINSEGIAMKLAQLEGAEDGEAFASGMAAISTTLMSLLSKGDHMIASPDCYGGAYCLMTEALGIQQVGYYLLSSSFTISTCYPNHFSFEVIAVMNSNVIHEFI